MRIPFFNYKKLYLSKKNNYLKKFNHICSNGSFIMQKELLDFEKNLAKFQKCKYAIGVGNATDALQLLLKAAGIKNGDEVIFCTHTMITTASAIKFCGAIPVPVDCASDHLIDLESFKKAITQKTKGVVVTQLNGRIADMSKILMIAKEYKIKVFEDAAQALGARFKNRFAGSFGVGGCISFYPAKILGCFGDGGAVITNNKNIFLKIRALRDHGRNSHGEIVYWGYNSRLDNLQAGFLNVLFRDINKIINKRRYLASSYFNNLQKNRFLKLPPNTNQKNHFDVYQNYEIECYKRNQLKEYLYKNGVGTILQWGGKAVHEFKKINIKKKLPKTEKIMRNSLLLPMNYFLKKSDIDYICKVINKFYENSFENKH
jgi:dTDP-4-amino-4,6-dideoxygalactose transaminase